MRAKRESSHARWGSSDSKYQSTLKHLLEFRLGIAMRGAHFLEGIEKVLVVDLHVLNVLGDPLEVSIWLWASFLILAFGSVPTDFVEICFPAQFRRCHGNYGRSRESCRA